MWYNVRTEEVMELLILAPFCLMGVAFVGALILVIILGRRRSQPYSAEETAQAEAAAETYLDRTVPALLPWTPEALADLACQWRGTRGGLVIGQHQGQVVSLSQPDGPGWLAFALSLKGYRGFLHVLTSDREIRLEIGPGGFRVTVDGQLLGSLREKDGALFDSQAQPIGCYRRYRGLRWQMGSRSLSTRYGPVELYGRQIAEVSDGLNWGGGPLGRDDARRPLIRLRGTELTYEEENWLLSVVAMELYYSALRQRSRPHV